MKKVIFILFFLISAYCANSQGTHKSDTVTKIKLYRVAAVIINGDTVPYIGLPEVKIYAHSKFANRHAEKRYDKLVRNVKKVYPYAKLAGIRYKEYNEMLLKVKNDKEKKRLMKQVEADLKKQFGPELEKLTFSQGKILLKLIDRETGNTSYAIVDEFRGWFSAFFWQSFARIFGYNLKEPYDPYGEDSNIELIVLMIENGQI
ncbi:MAG: DUF4294 domain-containing protein [Lentimicrobiaceae bacterium]|nr:DUF4294 domain-containing protein [Lentimicrobiaceae bacterium]